MKIKQTMLSAALAAATRRCVPLALHLLARQ